MSWGGAEWSGESSYDSVFTTPAGHPGVVFIASSGDQGAPPSYPALSPNVLSVGGTSLYLISSNNWSSESAWSGSGGGISSYESQPAYQHGVVTQSTTKRTNPDVAYDANPSTGFPVYNTYSYPTAPWQQFGGTSDAAPLKSGVKTRNSLAGAVFGNRSPAIAHGHSPCSAYHSHEPGRTQLTFSFC
jgi:subtilase family serine protease